MRHDQNHNFKFEPFWRFNSDFKEVTTTFWNENNHKPIQNSIDLQNGLARCGQKLRLGGKDKFGNLARKISALQSSITKINNQIPSIDNRVELQAQESAKLSTGCARTFLAPKSSGELVGSRKSQYFLLSSLSHQEKTKEIY